MHSADALASGPAAATAELADVAILGAGVIGMASAYAAAQRGLSVCLVERAAGPAQGTSFANGAQLSYAYTDAMASPGLWRQLPRMLGGRDPAFRMRWSADPDFLRWGLAFLGNARTAPFRRNTLATLELALESRLAMHALLQRHRLQFDHATPGKMHLYRDRGSLDGARDLIALKQRYGVEQEVLSPAQAIALEPALATAGPVTGVVYSPQEEVGDPLRFCTGLLQVLKSEYAVQAQFAFDADRIVEANGRFTLQAADGRRVHAKRLLLCAGIDSAATAATLGIHLPLMPVKGYSLTAPCGPCAPQISITDAGRKLVFCRLGQHMRIAGLADLGHWQAEADPARARQLLESARQTLPDAADYQAIHSHWAGLRPMTANSVPLIRRERRGLVSNVGHGMLGWTLAMGAGERALRLALQD